MISEVFLRQSVTRYFREGIAEGRGIVCFHEDTPEMDQAPDRWLLIRIGNLSPRVTTLSRGHLELLPTSRKGNDEGFAVAEIRDAVMELFAASRFTLPYLNGDMVRTGSLLIPDGGIAENERLLTGPGDTRFKIITVSLRFAM